MLQLCLTLFLKTMKLSRESSKLKYFVVYKMFCCCFIVLKCFVVRLKCFYEENRMGTFPKSWYDQNAQYHAKWWVQVSIVHGSDDYFAAFIVVDDCFAGNCAANCEYAANTNTQKDSL